MTAIDFPDSPTVGQLFTVGDVTWEWTGSVWQGLGTPTPGPEGPGVAAGGTAGQLLAKVDSTDYNTQWSTSDGVRVFADATARGSAISAPVEGMYTHLENSDKLEFWNGSAWVSPFGTTLLSTTSFTSQSSLTIDNIFTTQFRDYKIVFYADTATSGASLLLRFRASGSTTTTTYNSLSGVLGDAFGSVSRLGSGNATSIVVSSLDMFSLKTGEITIYAPQVAERVMVSQVGGSRNAVMSFSFGDHDSSTQFDGFTILTSTGNMSGTLSVYGLRK